MKEEDRDFCPVCKQRADYLLLGSTEKIHYDHEEYTAIFSIDPDYELSCNVTLLDDRENIVLDMGVKWDGCANTSTGNIRWHTCNREDFKRFGELLEVLYIKAWNMIPKKDRYLLVENAEE